MDNVLPVVVTTNGKRRRLCLFVLNTLLDNLKYDGSLFFCISCDRCPPEVLSEIGGLFKARGHEGYELVVGSGFADTLNSTIDSALSMNDVFFRTEDDYVLEKELDLTKFVDIIRTDSGCGAIKFMGPRKLATRVDSSIPGMTYILPNTKKDKYSMYTVSMYPSLMHRRTFDAIGKYRFENGKIEEDFCMRFNMQSKIKVLTFSDKPGDRMKDDDLWFVHAGRSAMGHNCPYNRKYDYLNAQKDEITTLKDSSGTMFPSIGDFFGNSFCISVCKGGYGIFERRFMRTFGIVPKMFRGYKINHFGPITNIALSHSGVVRMAKAMDMPYVGVFEEDAYPSIDASSRLLPLLRKIPSDTRLFYLGWLTVNSVRKRYIVDDDIAKVSARIPGFHSYILFRSGYDDFLARASNINRHVDISMTHFGGSAIARNPIFIQASKSTTSHHGAGYGGGKVNGRLPSSHWRSTPPDGFAPIDE